MALDMRLPQLSDEMAEGLVSRWLKQVGESVRKGEPIVEIETEKVIVEVEAEADGVLIEIVAAEQDTVPVGGVLCRIGKAGEALAASKPKADAQPQPQPQPEPAAAAKSPAPAAAEPTPDPSPAAAASSNVVPMVQPAQTASGGGASVPATPLARRIATELGIDLSRVEGSGIGGKIVKTDLQPYLGRVAAQQLAPPPSAPSRGAPTPTAPGAVPAGEAVPHSPMRRTVARRMAESKSQIPHFYMTAEADVTELLKLRGQLNVDGEAPKISVNDLMIKAVALTLERVPGFNAAYTEEATVYAEGVHVGFAVAIEGGLVTPVVRDCHLKSIGRIARESSALIERAKERRLTAADLEGGTFTISNLGMYDVVEFSAIINPPQVGILAIARPVERPVVADGRVVVRSRMNATLSADHRAVDGVIAAEFLREFKAVLESPVRLMR